MKSIKSKILFGLASIMCVAFVLIFCLCGSNPGILSASLSLTNQLTKSNKISFEVHNYEGGVEDTSVNEENVTILLPGNITQENYDRKSYNWRDTKYLTFHIDTSTISTQDREFYTFSYSLIWVPSLIANGQASFDVSYAIESALVSTKNVETKEEIPTDFSVYLDETAPTSENQFNAANLFKENYNKIGGWGLYLFSFSLDGKAEYSSVIEILPDDVHTLAKPLITPTTIKSSNRLNAAYRFSIDDSYRFVDRQQIKWFVSGKTSDGRDFVLEEADKDNENQNFLYETGSSLRNGLVFDFDPIYEGTWQVSCRIYEPDRETEIAEFRAETDTVSTVRGMSQQSIIWIVVAAAAAAGIIVAVVIIVSIKKEKVY